MPAQKPEKSRLFNNSNLVMGTVAVLSVLFGLTVLFIIGYSYQNSAKATLRLSDDLMDHINRSVNEQVQHYFYPAQAVMTIGSSLARDQLAGFENPAPFEQFGRDALQAYPQFARLHYGDRDGNFVMLIKDNDGLIHTKIIDQAQSPPLVRWRYRNHDGTVREETSPDIDFDPRERPWYQGAAHADGLFWTDLYVFFTDQQLGLTASYPVKNDAGAIQGVISIDIELHDLSEFLKKVKIGQNGRVFIINDRLELVADPLWHSEYRLARADRLRAYRPIRITQIGDPRVTAIVNEFVVTKAPRFIYENPDERYICSFEPIGQTGRHDWQVVLIVPEADFIATLQRTQRHSVWLAVFVLSVALGCALALIRVERRLNQTRLEKEKAQLAAIENLKKADQLKDEFLANTSHELRTPLNGIIGLAESLGDMIAPNRSAPLAELIPKLRKDLGMIVSSGRRLTTLINDILDFSKLKNHELVLQNKAVDLRVLTNIVFRLNQPVLIGKPVQLINRIDPETPPAQGDENRLHQIMHNLVGNAIKFTAGGEITVDATISPEMNQLVISVRDTGIGIPPEAFARIFESFEQGDGSIAREYGGAGIGLAVTKKLVELHGGKIWLESMPGQGSTFFFSLPVAEPSIRGELAPEDTKTEFDPGTTLDTMPPDRGDPPGTVNDSAFQVLIVDDEPVNLEVLSNHLALHNYAVTQVGSGPEALAMLTGGKKFDLVILDIMMPKMSGYEVCRQLRQRFLPSDLPVIMLTAKDRVNDIVTGFNCGANDYLTKPFSKDELLSRIKSHLNLREIHEATQRFVPQQFLQTLGRDSIVDVHLGDQIQKEMSVLFSDIRGYTSLAESMTPAETFNFINSYLGRMGPIIRHHEGFVNQYYGDGIMAIFPNAADHALQAAIGMQHGVAQYNGERMDKGCPPIQIGIGLHTGSLMLGIIGDGDRTDTGVVADTVNTAARMEGLTKYYGVPLIASETTIAGLVDCRRYHLRYLDRVMVKGKIQPIKIFEVLDALAEKPMQQKLSYLNRYSEAINAYNEREFHRAGLLFRELLRIAADDIPLQLYSERAARYEIEGVPEDWDGVEVMVKK